MNLEVGCGDRPVMHRWKRNDIRDLPGIDFVCASWDIHKHVEAGSVDQIYSRHFFEHLTFDEGRRTLESWRLVLKSGGTVEMLVPDMTFHIIQWRDPDRKTTKTNKGLTSQEWAIRGFWGQQRGDWDIHKSGYDYDLLRDAVTAVGFVGFYRVPDKRQHLHVAFGK